VRIAVPPASQDIAHYSAGPAHGHGAGRHGDGHDHSVTADNEKRLLIALALIAVFMVVEVVGGLLAGSLALLADAGHMLADTGALGLSWLAFRMAARPPDEHRSYGYHRFQILAAFINSLALFVIAGWIIWEAFGRVEHPHPVLAGPMLIVALAGLVVNIVAFVLLNRGDRHNVNMRGAMLHVLSDLLGSLAAIIAALVIMATGWTPIDPLLSVLVALLVLRSAWGLVRRSAHILMEGSPEGFDADALKRDLVAAVPGLADVHHVHAWALTAERPMITLHLRAAEGRDPYQMVRDVKQRLREQHGFEHSTVQVDDPQCPDD
jgi:cobalt-zinc-cadmium efflux system protein